MKYKNFQNYFIAGACYFTAAVFALFVMDTPLDDIFGSHASIDPLSASVLIPALSLVLAAIFGAWFGQSIRSTNTSFKTTMKVGIKVPVCATLLSTFLVLATHTAYNYLYRQEEYANLGISLVTNLYMLLMAPMLALAGTALITVPISMLASWILWSMARRTLQALIPAALLVTFYLGSVYVSNQSVVPADTQRIALDRPPGSSCSEQDSASVKRRDHHPRGPTGGWSTVVGSYPDKSRLMRLDENEFIQFNASINGYVNFAEPGELRVRAYDNLYGSVYCNWNKFKIIINDSLADKQRMHVRLPMCFVGDGGTETVHEVCWFPKGGSQGRIVYSSAWNKNNYSFGSYRKKEDSILRPSDVYLETDLRGLFSGPQYYATAVLSGLIEDRKYSEALKVVEIQKKDLLNSSGAVDSRGNRIAAQNINPDGYVDLLLYQFALLLVTGDLQEADKSLDEVISFTMAKHNFCTSCKYIGDETKLYRWLLSTYMDKQKNLEAILEFDKPTINFFEHNAYEIAQFLLGKRSLDKFITKSQSVNLFWAGVQCRRTEERDCERYFSEFLKRGRLGTNPVETTLAGWML